MTSCQLSIAHGLVGGALIARMRSVMTFENASQACTYFLMEDDVRAACPDVLICRKPRGGRMQITRRFLLCLIRTFFDLLSIRACRRNLVSHYSNTALAMRGPHASLYCISEVPRNHPLGAVLICDFDGFLRNKAHACFEW